MMSIARHFKNEVRAGKRDTSLHASKPDSIGKGVALTFKKHQRKKQESEQQSQLAADYEAETIRQTAEDYDQFQLQVNSLETDLKRLSGLSPGDKDKLKLEDLIPKYQPLAQSYLDSEDSYRNPILVEVIIMMLDTRQIPEAMDFIHYAIEQKQPMQERFKKVNLPTFIADTVLVWASAQIARGKDHEPEFSQIFESMVEDGWKVPRELIAKYHKLAGDVEAKNEHFEQALEHFVRATEIDPTGAKCSGKINQMKKKLDR